MFCYVTVLHCHGNFITLIDILQRSHRLKKDEIKRSSYRIHQSSSNIPIHKHKYNNEWSYINRGNF